MSSGSVRYSHIRFGCNPGTAEGQPASLSQPAMLPSAPNSTLLRQVNKTHGHAGYTPVPSDCIRYQRKTTLPYTLASVTTSTHSKMCDAVINQNVY